MAQQVIERDEEIDRTEIAVEEECLKILALHQPVAVDLRFIISVLKINNDLERIGDMAGHIAEWCQDPTWSASVAGLVDFGPMAEKAQAMLRQSLDALVNLDADASRRVRASDEEVDAMDAAISAQILGRIKQDPEHAEALIHLLGICRHLERVGDLAANIAEDVIYMVQGEIVRHSAER
jgi:phosphate transport system protein